MIRGDLPAVTQIEREAFEFPWDAEDFLEVLRTRNTIGMVAELPKGVIAGYMIYELHRDSMEIINLAIRSDMQRDGFGILFVQKMKWKAEQASRKSVTAVIRETNLPAQLFFKSMGFRATGVLRNYYEDTAEDAIAFVYELPSPDLAKRG